MKETLYHTKFLDLKSTLSKSGKPWFYAHRPNVEDIVIILPHTKDEVLLLIEERPPINAENIAKYTIGTAAGLVGDERVGETIEDAIKNELLEETGLVSDSITIKTKKVASSAGCLTEISTIALAFINDKTEKQSPVNDGGIIVDRIWVNKNNISKWLKVKEADGYVITSQLLAALFYLFE